MLISKKLQVESKKLQTQLSSEKSYQIKSDGKLDTIPCVSAFTLLISFSQPLCVFPVCPACVRTYTYVSTILGVVYIHWYTYL
jgi:hypothetical protein